MKEMILTVGLPRSGKSTVIKDMRTKNDSVVVCPDRIRKVMFGHQFFAPVEGMVWSTAFGMVNLLLEQDKSIVIDATNLTFSERKRWYDTANTNGLKDVTLIIMTTAFEECLKRNETCPIDERVPEEVMARMLSRFEYPDETEVADVLYNFDNCKVVKVNLSEVM